MFEDLARVFDASYYAHHRARLPPLLEPRQLEGRRILAGPFHLELDTAAAHAGVDIRITSNTHPPTPAFAGEPMG